MTGEFYCKFCDLTCTGKEPYEQHIRGGKHLKKVKAFESLSSNSEQSITSPKLATSSSANNQTNSNESTLPAASFSIGAETMRTFLEWNHPDGHRPYCDICYLLLHGDDNASAHFARDNDLHYNRLAVWKKIQEESPVFSCRVCSDIFPNENSMRDHFSSTVHSDRTRDKEAMQKFIKIYETYNKFKEVRLNRIAKEKAAAAAASSTVDNQFIDKFQNMKVIEGNSTVLKSSSGESVLFTKHKLSAAMKKFDDDDDDDD